MLTTVFSASQEFPEMYPSVDDSQLQGARMSLKMDYNATKQVQLAYLEKNINVRHVFRRSDHSGTGMEVGRMVLLLIPYTLHILKPVSSQWTTD